jgi:predicted DNA-binding antitoxin AbrB/MazE fold protein
MLFYQTEGTKMLVIEALFRNGQFIPESPVSLPENSKVSLTIEEENNENGKPGEINQKENREAWWEFERAIREIKDEALSGDFPTRVKFRTPEEIESL